MEESEKRHNFEIRGKSCNFEAGKAEGKEGNRG